MRSAAPARRADPERLAELQTWYVERMRPKLTRATEAGSIMAAEAAALDRDMRGLLELPHEDEGQ